LANYAEEHGCEGITVRHIPKSDKDYVDGRQEHGPFEGAGFFKDLAIVSQARHGLVATSRSSSGLLQNIMVYDRTMERLSKQIIGVVNEGLTMPQLHGMQICYHQFAGPARPDWSTSS
jgi:hypothetical protein